MSDAASPAASEGELGELGTAGPDARSEERHPAAADDDLGRRVADWYAETALRRADIVTELDDGAWLVRTPRWPDSFAGNAIVVRRDVGGERLVAWAEEHLGGAGLDHRFVTALCPLSDATRHVLEAAGYRLEELLEMSLALWSFPALGNDHTTSDIRVGGAGVAERVDPVESGRLHTVMWQREWMPGIDDEEVRQLVGRRLEDPSGELLSWVVRDAAADDPVSGDMVACADLVRRGWTAEIDAVATLARFRGRGYAGALVAAAVSAARDLGCTHVVLSALAEDWPRHWYARLGFVEVARAWEALRRDDGLGFSGPGGFAS